MPGITGGDIGPKFGYNSKNNGWLRFDKVRIPRDYMLMKFVTVDKEGNFEIIGDLRILYGVMMMVRVQLVIATSFYLAFGLTITTRYACVRR